MPLEWCLIRSTILVVTIFHDSVSFFCIMNNRTCDSCHKRINTSRQLRVEKDSFTIEFLRRRHNLAISNSPRICYSCQYLIKKSIVPGPSGSSNIDASIISDVKTENIATVPEHQSSTDVSVLQVQVTSR